MTQDTLWPLNTLVLDMNQGSEARPHGLTADWAAHPRIAVGNAPAAHGFSKILGWGAIYEAASGNAATNTRVEVKDLQLWVLSKSTGQWSLLQTSADGVAGALYRENFSTDVSKSAQARTEADGGTSAKPGQGYDWHFWSDDVPMAIPAKDVGGVIMSYAARLVVDDATKADDRGHAHYVGAAGADYWNAAMSNNDDAGIGRFKALTGDYRSFTMSTLSADDLMAQAPSGYLAHYGITVVHHEASGRAFTAWDDYRDGAGKLVAQVYLGADDKVLSTATYEAVGSGTRVHVERADDGPFSTYDKFLDKAGAVKAQFFYDTEGHVTAAHAVTATGAAAPSDAAYVDGLYQTVFGRHVTAAEAHVFANESAHGATRAEITHEVAEIAKVYYDAHGHDLLV